MEGRVDRIGGRPQVSIRNYFYVGTVEEQIYTGIADDVDWFEDIVGPAQPVLGQVEDVIEHIAMLMPDADRDKAVVAEIAKIRASIEEAKARSVSMDDVGRAPDEKPSDLLHPAIDLAGLEQVLTRAAPVAERFHSHPTIPGVYLIETEAGKAAVTFRRPVLETHPELKLLTYGTKELDELLGDVADPTGESFGVRGTLVVDLDGLESALGASTDSL